MELKIHLKNIAKFQDKNITLSNDYNVIVITAPNGTGKTSLLKSLNSVYTGKNDPSIVGPHGEESYIKLEMDGRVYEQTIKKGSRLYGSTIKGGISYNFDDLLSGNIFSVIAESYNTKIKELARVVNTETVDVEYAIKQVEKARAEKRTELKKLSVYNKTETELNNIKESLDERINSKEEELVGLKQKLLDMEGKRNVILKANNHITQLKQDIEQMQECLPEIIKSKSQVQRKIERMSMEAGTELSYRLLQVLIKEKVLSEESKANIEAKLEGKVETEDRKDELNKYINYLRTFDRIELMESEILNESAAIDSIGDQIDNSTIKELKDEIDRLESNKSTLEKRKFEIAFGIQNLNRKIEIEKRMAELDRTLNELIDIKKSIMEETNDRLDRYNETLARIIGYTAEVEKTDIKSRPVRLLMTDSGNPSNKRYFEELSDGEQIVATVLLLSEHAVKEGIGLLLFDRFESVSNRNRYALVSAVSQNYPSINYVFSAVDSIYSEEQLKNTNAVVRLEK